MVVDDLKRTISERTGIPEQLLSENTAEELITKAKTLLSLRKEQEEQQPKSTREQFAEWVGQEKPDSAGLALAEIESDLKLSTIVYPIVYDGGEVDYSVPKTPVEELRDLMTNSLSPRLL